VCVTLLTRAAGRNPRWPIMAWIGMEIKTYKEIVCPVLDVEVERPGSAYCGELR